MGALKIARLLPGWGPEAKGCGQGLAPEDVSTPGLGQGEGPVGYKFFSKEEDASPLAGFRLRKGRRRRWEGPEWRPQQAAGTEFLRSQVPACTRADGRPSTAAPLNQNHLRR